MKTEEIKVLIVEDSVTVSQMLQRILKKFVVVGVAKTATEALRLERIHRPDVITMDIDLPDMDGLTLTKKILSVRNIPIIIITSLVSSNSQPLAFDCLEAGAYEILAKSQYLSSDGGKGDRLPLLVKTAATNRARMPQTTRAKIARPASSVIAKEHPRSTSTVKRSISSLPAVIAIGASTGGPQALKEILEQLPKDYATPIVISQHMTPGFIDGYARWLDSQIGMAVSVAKEGETVEPGHVYFAPSKQDVGLDTGRRIRLQFSDGEGVSPNIDHFFHSVTVSLGKRAVYILLTGMGSDGASGILAAYESGALTVVQDESTSVIFGMPKEAIARCPGHHVLPLPDIVQWMKKHFGVM